MDISYVSTRIEMGKEETIEIEVYVDNGEVLLSPLRIVISTGTASGENGLISVFAPNDSNPDGKEYFMSKDGLTEAHML
jgi:hypothetical protein